MPPTATGMLPDLSNALADAVERAANSTVTVSGRDRLPSSGIVWRSGVIVSADHTLERDEEIGIGHPDLPREARATLAGRDGTTDLAVLRVENCPLPVAEGREIETVKVGHLALAVGRPHSGGPSASMGVISAIGAEWTTWRGGRIDRFLHADIDLPYGFSGGPLIDAQGRVIGMNTSGLSRRFDLTIPRATVNRVVDQLLAKGRIARGYLGLGMQPVRIPDHVVRSLRLSGNGGIIIISVEPGQPAERAGVLIGDVLVAIDGTPIDDPGDVLAALGPERIGATIALRLIRAGELKDVPITVGERPAHWE